MKNWKYCFSALLLSLILSVLLPGVSLAEDWFLQQVRIDTAQATDIAAETLGKTGILSLQEDGSATLDATGLEPFSGTWTEEGGVITLSNDATTLTLYRSEEEITLHTTGLVLVFTKVASEEKVEEAFQAPTALVAASQEEFYGTYTAQWCVTNNLTIRMADIQENLQFIIDATGVTMVRNDNRYLLSASFNSGVLVLSQLEVALALDDDGSLSMVQGGMTFFFDPETP